MLISLPTVENAIYAELEAYKLTMNTAEMSFVPKTNFDFMRNLSF